MASLTRYIISLPSRDFVRRREGSTRRNELEVLAKRTKSHASGLLYFLSGQNAKLFFCSVCVEMLVVVNERDTQNDRLRLWSASMK